MLCHTYQYHQWCCLRDDLILYTITSDSTLRVFFPVLDSPNHLQLHAALDIYSALPYPLKSDLARSRSSIFWLDRKVIGDALIRVLKDRPELHDGPSRRLKDINDEGWDLFLRVLADGSIVVSAIAVSSFEVTELACPDFAEHRSQTPDPS